MDNAIFCLGCCWNVYSFASFPRVVGLWREEIAKKNPKAAQSLADPTEYENLFPEIKAALKAEQYLKQERKVLRPAGDYLTVLVREKTLKC